jgi:hypothetical protein
MNKFRLESDLSDTLIAKLFLFGEINENFHFDDYEKIFQPTIQIDFDQVTYLNSCGLRDFGHFLKKFENKKIFYVNCPKLLVGQLNRVKGMVPENCKILSFYAPYYLESSDKEIDIKLFTSEIIDGKAPLKNDPETGEELVFDENENLFFRFINNKSL